MQVFSLKILSFVVLLNVNLHDDNTMLPSNALSTDKFNSHHVSISFAMFYPVSSERCGVAGADCDQWPIPGRSARTAYH